MSHRGSRPNRTDGTRGGFIPIVADMPVTTKHERVIAGCPNGETSMCQSSHRGGKIETAPEGAATPVRGLTRSSDQSREGLLVDATRVCRDCGKTITQRRNKLYCNEQCRTSFLLDPEAIYARLMERIDTSGGPDACHPWMGWRDKRNYGGSQIDSKKIRVHRWLLGYLRGVELTAGEEACHTCDNPPCCNPAHLYVGDHKQNMHDMAIRGRGRPGQADWTHCIHGHEFTTENIHYPPGNLRRQCRECGRIRTRKHRANRRAA